MNLNVLYNLVINRQILNKKVLLDNGYSETDITMFLQEGKLEELDGNYSFKDVNSLYEYGETLILNSDYNKANACFRICIEIDPTHRDSYLQRIVSSLKNDDFELVVRYFSNMLKIEGEEFTQDNNLYILLINYFCDIPFEGKKLIFFRDIALPKTMDDKNNFLNNDVREHIYNTRLTFAMHLINEYYAEHRNYNIKLLFLKTLLSKAIYAFDKVREDIFMLACEERFFDIYEMLMKIKSIRKLSSSEVNILMSTSALIQILRTKQIPEVTVHNPKSIHEALKGNDFVSAIILDKQFLVQHKINKKDDALFLILSRICKTINKLESLQNESNISIHVENDDLCTEDITQKLNDILFFMKHDGLSIDETITKFNLSKAEILLFKLLISKDAISLGYENLGLYYLNEVKNNSEIDEFILDAIKEIEENLAITRKRVEN